MRCPAGIAIRTRWPFFGLRISTPRLELRVPDDEDLVELFEAARAGIHPAGRDAVRRPLDRRLAGAGRRLPRFLAFHWAARGAALARALVAAVRRDRRGPRRRASRSSPRRTSRAARSVRSGSWLTASAQGRGLGVEMRAAVLHLAFAGLGALEAQTSAWIDNEASQRVSLRLGYRAGRRGAAGSPRRADAAPALPAAARGVGARTTSTGIELHGLAPCLPLLGAA